MNNLSDFLQAVCDELKDKNGDLNASFITKYPGVLKASPLIKTVVSVGFNSVEMTDSYIGGEFDKKAVVQIELLVCVPLFSQSIECLSIMQKLIEDLWFDSSFNVKQCSLGSVKVNRETGAYELCGLACIDTNITKAVV
ncbi:MAG: hypothetical protein EOM05_05635 [Clostridia bacterium]|nr:hypothetical protein [Clostridia bacterium]